MNNPKDKAGGTPGHPHSQMLPGSQSAEASNIQQVNATRHIVEPSRSLKHAVQSGPLALTQRVGAYPVRRPGHLAWPHRGRSLRARHARCEQSGRPQADQTPHSRQARLDLYRRRHRERGGSTCTTTTVRAWQRASTSVWAHGLLNGSWTTYGTAPKGYASLEEACNEVERTCRLGVVEVVPR